MVIIGATKIEYRCANPTIGSETSLGRCEIALYDYVEIGYSVCINDEVKLLSASHDISDTYWKHKKSPILFQRLRVDSNYSLWSEYWHRRCYWGGSRSSNRRAGLSIFIGNPAHALNGTRTKALRYSPAMLNAPFEA